MRFAEEWKSKNLNDWKRTRKSHSTACKDHSLPAQLKIWLFSYISIHVFSTIGYITNSRWPALHWLAWVWIERCVRSSQRSRFDSRSQNLNDFKFLSNRLCYFLTTAKIMFNFISLSKGVKIWLISYISIYSKL